MALTMSQLLQSIGAAFYPLRRADDVADLMEAAARVPASTPRRAARIVEYLASKFSHVTSPTSTAYEVSALLLDSKTHGNGRFEQVVSTIPIGDKQVIVTDRTTCIVCEGELVEAVNEHGRLFRASPSLFTQDGVVRSSLFWLRCVECKARHYYSYAVGGDHLPPGTAQVYPNWKEARYVHVTDETVFERRTLERFRQQCLHSHTSFRAFATEYTALSTHSGLANPQIWAKLLAHAWRAFELVTWLQEMGEGCPSPLLIPLSDEAKLDDYLLASTPRMLKLHVELWGLRHSSLCLQPDTCTCYVLDGHMKCVRSVCANKHARVLNMGALGTAVLGCTHMPVQGSIYCRVCLDASAVRGAAGEISVAAMDSAVMDETADLEAATVVEAGIQKDVYLVQDVLDAERQTVERGGPAHRACARASKKRFLVSWVGYPEDQNSWVCECNVGKAVAQLWKDKKAAEAQAQKAFRQATKPGAAAFNFVGAAAALNSGAATGDFNLSALERQEITEQTNCACLKDQHTTGRAATAGILALVASCGLILAASEIYGSESLTQVHLFLYTIFMEHGLPPPEVLVYDDACHLSMFLINRLGRFGRSILAAFLLSYHRVKIAVDKLHWKNHTGLFCRRNNNPYKIQALDRAKTERCEETFQWLSKSKHFYRHMNEARFMFTMLRMMHHRNVYLSSIRPRKDSRAGSVESDPVDSLP